MNRRTFFATVAASCLPVKMPTGSSWANMSVEMIQKHPDLKVEWVDFVPMTINGKSKSRKSKSLMLMSDGVFIWSETPK